MEPDIPPRPDGPVESAGARPSESSSGSTGEQAASGIDPRQEPVFCPMLGALVQNGQLKPDKAGRVKFGNVDRAMRSAGISLPFRWALTGTSPTANRVGDILRNVTTLSFDLYALRGGLVAHKGDSGILNGGTFDEDIFRTFVAYSQDGKTMTVADFARASTHDGLRDGRRSANVRARANLAAIITALGYVDEAGVRRIDIQTLRDLYEHTKLSFPGGVMPKTGLWDLFRLIREMGRATPTP